VEWHRGIEAAGMIGCQCRCALDTLATNPHRFTHCIHPPTHPTHPSFCTSVYLSASQRVPRHIPGPFSRRYEWLRVR
jgi:hypothetical protein